MKVANREGATPLSLACLNGNAALVESLLKAGADANEKMPRGETALMMASRTGNLATMKALLDHGAKVIANESLRGTTALMWAADQGHADAVSLLVERGADFSARSNPASRGGTAYLGKANDPRKSNKALVAAAAGASPEEIARLSSKDNRQFAPPPEAQAGAPQATRSRSRPAGQRRQPAAGRRTRKTSRRSRAAAVAGYRSQRRWPHSADLRARANSLDTVEALLAKGADVNETSGYGERAAGGHAESVYHLGSPSSITAPIRM